MQGGIFFIAMVSGISASSFVDGMTGMEYDGKGQLWFRELSDMWEGQSFSLKVEKIIHHSFSAFQEILVFENNKYGKVFALDGAIQTTELDEVSYQEVMAHTPMHLHESGNVKRVLVIGGGDGGVLRELAKYPEIEQIFICEIDADVIEVAKQHLPSTSIGYLDPRVTVFVQDGFQFLEWMVKDGIFFDVVVSDLSDPIGPAESIFDPKFFRLLARVLEPTNGVAALQGEAYWLHSDIIKPLISEARKLFSHVGYASIAIPTYPTGQIGSIIMSKNPARPVDVVVREGGLNYEETFYYTTELHRAQFVLPTFVKKQVYP
jgi:spermidine synthase